MAQLSQRDNQRQEDLDLGSKLDIGSSFDEAFKDRRVEKPVMRSFRSAAKKKVAGGERSQDLDLDFENFDIAKPKSEPKKKVEATSPKLVSFDDDYVDFNDDGHPTMSMDSLKKIMNDIGKFATCQAEALREMETADMLVGMYDGVVEFVTSLPKHQRSSKNITSLGLIFYGGSWPTLASVFAAVEAFGTKSVALESYSIFKDFLATDPVEIEENDVTPQQIKDAFSKMGLQVALMIAVFQSPSWAEICVAVAFASKLASLCPMDQILSSALKSPDAGLSELEEWFSMVDREWFALLSTLACNIFSLTLFGCFPRFVTALYMGVLGLETFTAALPEDMEFYIPLGDMAIPIFSFERSEYFSKDSTKYVWGFNVFMALWQAYSGYSGTFMAFSWLMFLLPVVKLASLLTAGALDKMNANAFAVPIS